MQSNEAAGAEKTEETTAGAENDSPGIEHLDELLNAEFGGSDETNSTDEDSSDRGSEEDSPLTKFNDLAGRLEVDLEDLYQLEVSQAKDGTPITVETLKDAYANQADLDVQKLEFEEHRTQVEARLVQAEKELQEIMASLPRAALNKQSVEKARQRISDRETAEKRKTLEVIPGWKDETVRRKEIGDMVAHLKQYGFPSEHLGNVVDHRQMKYIRDNMRREQLVRAAMAKIKSGKPNSTPASKPGNGAPKKKTAGAADSRKRHGSKLDEFLSTVD